MEFLKSTLYYLPDVMYFNVFCSEGQTAIWKQRMERTDLVLQ